jgi:hypothetical protein
MLTSASQFQEGARGLRSDIVSLLKHNGLLIFNITDIEAGDFLDKDARLQSGQLEALREKNSFLYASEKELPGVAKVERYMRSGCIVRVSIFLSSQDYSANNIFQGIAHCTYWSESIERVEQAKEVPVESKEIRGNRNITLPRIIYFNRGTWIRFPCSPHTSADANKAILFVASGTSNDL